jgi:SPP1 gp7 family putative phage head morphogenesis protein
VLPNTFWDNERELLYELLFPQIQAAALAGAEGAMASIGIGVDWALINIQARAWARQYTYDLVSGITQTSMDFTRDAITDWITSGAPLDDLLRDLAPMFGKTRAEMIGATEVTRAFAEGNRILWRASGVVTGVKWQTAVDELVCDICGPLHNQTGDIETGINGMLPPAHPRCRCWILPVVRARE